MWIIIPIFILALFIIITKDFLDRLTKEKPKYPYKKKDFLLSVAEKNFYSFLHKFATENNYLLFVKVRLEDLFWIPQSISPNKRFGFRNRIKSRHIDFLLCDKDKIGPVLAIELDDSSHNRSKVIARDLFIRDIFAEADFPLIRFKVRWSYDYDYISEKIKEKLSKYESEHCKKCDSAEIK